MEALSMYMDECDFYGAVPADGTVQRAKAALADGQVTLSEGLMAHWLLVSGNDKDLVKKGVGRELAIIRAEGLQEKVLPLLLDKAQAANKFGMSRASASQPANPK